ncbi:hypothetical protein FQN60_009611 [Etheostoma spectabile]|uniref:Sema domain-containing protein n=1 Tax=Etheostoma spectabile TaxID=54343 RepID=A0A5J5DJF5_9PERO|nr:hypothetical protein FQN60_009611 [Etheostoma spectabile]
MQACSPEDHRQQPSILSGGGLAQSDKLRSTGTAHHFAYLLNTTDYRILRMDEDHDRMYVGSKDHILSLDLHDINKDPHIIHWPVSERRRMECLVSGKDANEECANFIRLVEPWNRTQLYVCGTGAYNPVCTFVNRGRKPQTSMYLQMAQARGRASRAAEPSAVHETLGLKEEIFHLEPGKVESGKGKCSYDPNLNSVSALINGELYAGVYVDFMGTDSAIFRTLGTKTAMRTDQYNSRWLNDPTFIHVQLIPDSAERNDDKLYFFFREKSSEMGHSPVTQSRIGRICLNDDGGHCCLVNKWSTFLKARLICSVPGADGMETHFDELREYKDARDYAVVLFPIFRDVYIQPTQDTKNPVIYGVFSVSGVRMVNDSVNKGTVQKVIVLPRDDLQTEELVLEEVEVFKVPTPITTMKISSKRQQLYVSSVLGLTQLALHRCDVYGEACADCCLARDPYCAWDGKSCSRYSASQKRRSRRQDVKYGNPIRQCRGFNSNANKNTLEMVQYGVEGSSTFLECQARSPHAVIKWHLQRDNSDRRKEMRSDGRVLKTEQGLLLRFLQPSDSGMYQCTATEKNFKHMLVKLQLVVLSSRAVNNVLVEGGGGLVPSSLHSSSTQWTPSAGQYKDLLTILSQPEMSLINQYCQDYWQFGDPLLGALKAKDLKELKEQKKPRNRRHHGEGEGDGEGGEKYEQEEQEEQEEAET